MKVKQVKYERLESDPHGYNNTKICMVADLDENDDPIQSLNIIRKAVLERHNAYREIRQVNIEIRIIASKLSHINYSLHQTRIDDETDLKIKNLREEKKDHEDQLTKLKHKIDKLLG